MIGNVQILKNNGESLISNGLAHFKFNNTNKQYVIYTLGEQINELLKIYIGYENAPVTDPGMTDEESTNITDLLKKIGKNEDVSTLITILPLTAGLYHIHDKVKKVALQTSAFNNVINTQQKGQIQTLNQDEPIVKENTFFDASVTKEENIQAQTPQEQSIFEKPIQPAIETSNDVNNVEEAKVEEQPSLEQEHIAENVSEITTGEASVSNDQQISTIQDSSYITTLAGEKELLYENNDTFLEETTISDEQAKNAILAVEKAQETIKDNIVIIKEFIKQQKNKSVSYVAETKLEEPKASEEQTMVSRVDPLPAQYDVVNNLKLAPQPEMSENVLSSESSLDSDYSIDTSTDQVFSGVDTSSLVKSSITVPKVELVQSRQGEIQTELEGQSNLPQTGQTAFQPSLEQQTGTAFATSVSLNEQKLPANTSLPNEQQPKIIDTMAMIPRQGVTSETSKVEAMSSLDNYNSEILDTTNMVATNNSANIGQASNMVLEDKNPKTINDDLAGSENQRQSVDYAEKANQNNINFQNAQNDTVDIQIPDVELDNSIITGKYTLVEQQDSVSNAPSINSNMTELVQKPSNGNALSGEFAIPQIDMNVTTLEGTQAPVVMPDGQTSDVNQGLVLTPEAFNKAA